MSKVEKKLERLIKALQQQIEAYDKQIGGWQQDIETAKGVISDKTEEISIKEANIRTAMAAKVEAVNDLKEVEGLDL